jgi:hypothetical protein
MLRRGCAAGMTRRTEAERGGTARTRKDRPKNNGLQCVNACKPLTCLVAWGGIELPTCGFSIGQTSVADQAACPATAAAGAA